MDPTLFPAGPRVTIRPWVDPVVDQHGHDPRSAYVERFWLGVIGPTATWIMRRFAAGFDTEPDGYTLDLDHTATSMGLSYSKGAASPFGKALRRCMMFGLVQPLSDGFAVRRRIPQVARRHLQRFPEEVRSAHESWVRATVAIDVRDLEAALISAGFTPRTAVCAVEAAAIAS